jgi:hypothetical protein
MHQGTSSVVIKGKRCAERDRKCMYSCNFRSAFICEINEWNDNGFTAVETTLFCPQWSSRQRDTARGKKVFQFSCKICYFQTLTVN